MKSKSITIKIEMNNSAFSKEESYYPEYEVARILQEFAHDISEDGFMADGYKLHDINGNVCGSVKLTGF